MLGTSWVPALTTEKKETKGRPCINFFNFADLDAGAQGSAATRVAYSLLTSGFRVVAGVFAYSCHHLCARLDEAAACWKAYSSVLAQDAFV